MLRLHSQHTEQRLLRGCLHLDGAGFVAPNGLLAGKLAVARARPTRTVTHVGARRPMRALDFSERLAGGKRDCVNSLKAASKVRGWFRSRRDLLYTAAAVAFENVG